jgi:hypothetical protein
MAAFEDYQREQLVDALKDQQQQNQNQDQNQRGNGNGSPSQQRSGVNGGATERQLQERLNEAQSRKEGLLNQLSEMQHQEDLYHGRSSSADGPPGGGSTPGRTGQQQQQQQQQQQGSASELYDAPPSSPNGVNDRNNGGSRQHQRQPQFEDDHIEDEIEEEEEEEEPPRRSMLRDRLGKASGEEMYKPKNGRRGGPADDFDDQDDDDMLSEEEERQFQHERMMRRDPVSPPVAMGPQRGGGGGGSAPRQQQQQQQRGGQRDRFNDDPRRSGGGRPSSPNMMHSDPDFLDDNEADTVQQKLGSMRAFKGDEPLQSKSLFGNDPIGNNNSNGRNNSSRKKQAAPAAAGGKKVHRTRGLTPPPASNPILDRKLEHFLKETLKDGPKPHFDKEMENLLLEKYQPLNEYGWLKPANVAFLRSVLCTFLEHKGCQVEMDLREASPKALREWDQLLDLLSYELHQWTNETPEIFEEPNNQWGIYGSKNVRMKTTTTNNNNNVNNGSPQQQGMTKEEMLRRKRRNDKAFHVSTDPSDVNHRML